MKFTFSTKSGMFAQMSIGLRAMAEAKHRGEGLTLKIVGRYNGIHDWFGQYFDLLKPDETDAPLTLGDRFTVKTLLGMKLADANKLFYEFASIKSDVLANCKCFDLTNAIGLHYRCSDKWHETEYVSFQQFVECAVRHIKAGEYSAMYVVDGSSPNPVCNHMEVASQVNQHLDHPLKVMTYSTSEQRSDHESGLETLLSSILLSRCRLIVRTCSCLSSWSKIWNPNLQVMTLNRYRPPFTLWPETEV